MYLAKYGAAFTFEAPIIKRAVVDLAVSADWTPASGDVKVSKDGGNVANIGTLPTAVGGSGSALWTWTLSATEMQAARVTIQVVDSATKAVEDQCFTILTYGHASAHIEVDLDQANLPANMVQVSGDSTAADNLETMLDGTGGQVLTLGQLRINSTAAGGGIDIDNSAGPAISAQSSADDALSLVSTGGGGHGLYAAGEGAGDGLHALGGVTGHGIHGTGGSTSGHGMRITAPTEGDGLEAVGAGAGKDIDADITGSLSGSVGSVSGAVGSVTGNVGGNVVGSVGSVAGNVSGSVASVVGAVGSVTGAVGSVTGNVGGSVASVTDRTGFSLSAAGILAIWDQLLSETFGVGSIGEKIKLFFAALGSDNRPKVSADAHTGGATITAVGTLTTYTGNTPQTGDAFARLGAPAGASVSVDIAAIKTDTGNLVTRITSTLFSGITSLAQWLGLIAGKQVGNTTARTELRATGAGSGTYDETADSQEAIRDRGDAAWTTGGGASGSNTVTFTVRDSSTLALLVGVPVNVFADDGTSLVDTEDTNGSGQAVFALNSNDYEYAVPAIPGYSSYANTALTVDGAEAITINLVAIPATVVSAGTRVVRVIVVSGAGAVTSGIVVSARLEKPRSSIANAFALNTQLTDTTDASGIADLTLITSDQFTDQTGDGYYIIEVPGAGEWRAQIPAGSGAYNLQVAIAG